MEGKAAREWRRPPLSNAGPKKVSVLTPPGPILPLGYGNPL